MKKILLSAAVILAAITGSAQKLSVASTDALPSQTCIEKATISADGSFVVGYSTQAKAIVKIDAASGQTTNVASGEDLYNVRLTGDQQSVVFTRPSYNKKHMRYISLEAASLADGATQVLVKPTRRLNHGLSLSGSTVTAVEKGKLRTKTLVKGQKAQTAPFASVSYGHLQVTRDGKTTTIDPQGRGSYIWASVSPDGQKVLYWLVGKGAYVANLDGSDSQFVGCLAAPVFAGNDIVVGCLQNGTDQVVTRSAIVAKSLRDNTVSVLTPDNVIAMGPSASADGSRIAYTDNLGHVFILNIVK